MTFEMQQAVNLLRNLLWLKSASLDSETKTQVDEVIDAILQAAFDDVKRLMRDWAQEVAEHEQRLIQAKEQAARDVVSAEQQAAKDLVQEAADEIQRDERQRLGVS